MEQSGFSSPWDEVVLRECSFCCPEVLDLLTPAPSRWDLCREAMLEVHPVAPGSRFFKECCPLLSSMTSGPSQSCSARVKEI